MRCVFLLLVTLYSIEGAQVGSSSCAFGPSYWCSSLRNAKECRAVSHCIQTVWETQNLPADNDDICTICKNMVQQARDTLESNETQEEIKQVFDGSCRLIPLRQVSDECVQLANDFIPELIETLSSQMNPQVVCATCGLCNSVRVDRLLREQGLPHDKPFNFDVAPADPNPKYCKDCSAFIADVVDEVRTHSRDELMDRLLAICGVLGSVSDGCGALVTVNIDAIYNFLTLDVDPSETCSLFGVCDTVSQNSGALQAGNKDEVCDFCVVIAKHWRDTLISNTTEEQFVEILEGLCMRTHSFSTECQALVETYALPAYDFLVKNFDPKEACEIVGICSQTVHNKKPVWTTLHVGDTPADDLLQEKPASQDPGHLKPSLHFVGNDEANALRYQNEIREQHMPVPSIKVTVAGESGMIRGSNEACTMCEFTLHFIQIQLQDKKTKEAIEHAVKNVCSHLPKDLSEQCDDYVDAYGDQVIALLQQEIDPSVLCPELGLCPSANSQSSVSSREVVTCVACEFIMKKVKDILGNERNEKAIEDALFKVCSVLPNALSTQCRTFVDNNAIEVMQLLAAGVDPEEVCRMLGFCHNNMGRLPPLTESDQLPMERLFIPIPRAVAPSTIETTGQSKSCIICEFIMNTLEKLVLDNSTHIEDEVQKGMDIVCLHLPSTLQEDCLGFVDQYSRAIIELLINEASPQTVCKAVKLCKAPAIHTMAVLAEEPVSDERSCLICKATASITTTDVENVAQNRESTLDNLCGSLAGGERALCGRLRTHVFNPSLDRTRQCASMGYCDKPLNLIGSEKCTYGPSYWCQSTLHAHSCGAVQHCQDRVWMGVSP